MSGFVTIKHAVERDFTVLNNKIIRDDRLSWKATGLLVWLLHLSPEWKLYLTAIKKFKKDGSESTRSGLQELMNIGYVQVKEIREGGRYKGTEWIITDNPGTLTNKGIPPRSGNPNTVTPEAALPRTGNPQLINTNSTRTKNNKSLNPATTAATGLVDEYMYKIQIKNEDDQAVMKTIQSCTKEEVNLAQQRLGPRRGKFPSVILKELSRFAVALQPDKHQRQIGDKLTQGKWGGFEEKNYRDETNPDGSF
ncbi:hypothetical protein [Sulfuricella sp.]|uniref:hypothetical protein n=1 Tax=Sulfuricella sp. TaxID=2099377 RepID=UPI002CD50694|nr:hypothetical protein [Sulfuricella sp.]HUX64322.1 hypothetical protein [Sulfuricella sp.]